MSSCAVRRQYSTRPCILNATFGCRADGGFWVSHGCRGVFACGGAADPFMREPREVPCSAWGNGTFNCSCVLRDPHRARHPPRNVSSTFAAVADTRCLLGKGAGEDWVNATVLVAAEYLEWHFAVGGANSSVPAWLLAQVTTYLYQRHDSALPCFCPNRAFEAGVYLQFVVQHWRHLPARVAFVQADWFEPLKNIRPHNHPFDFWQLRCNDLTALSYHWMPLGKRNTVWPPRQITRRSTFWEGHALALGVRGISHMVEACWRNMLSDFRLKFSSADAARADRWQHSRAALNVTFFPYMNLLVSRERLQSYPLTSYLSLFTRLVTFGSCLYPSTATGSDAEDGLMYDKLHASAFEVLQDAIFGQARPVEDGEALVFPARAEQCRK